MIHYPIAFNGLLAPADQFDLPENTLLEPGDPTAPPALPDATFVAAHRAVVRAHQSRRPPDLPA